MGEIIAVTGTGNGVGCTTMSVLLGGGTGERRRDVGLLDATAEGSRVADVLDVEPDEQLVAVARGDLPLRELQQDGPHGLSVYAGADTIGWADISSSAVNNLYELLRNRHERTFVDCGALGAPASSLWLAHADSLVIVTDTVDELDGDQLPSTADAFDLSVAGTVLNKAEQASEIIAAAEPTQLLAIAPVDEAAVESAAALQTPFRYDPDSPIADLGWRLAGRFDSDEIGDAVELPDETISPEDIRAQTEDTNTADEQLNDDSINDGTADGGGETKATALPTGNVNQSAPAAEPTPLGEPPTANSEADDGPVATEDAGQAMTEDDGAVADTQPNGDDSQPAASEDSTAVALPADTRQHAGNTTDRSTAPSDSGKSPTTVADDDPDQREPGFEWDPDVESANQRERDSDSSATDGSVDEATESPASEPIPDEDAQPTAGLRDHVESMVEVALQRNHEIHPATTAPEIDAELAALSDAELQALLQELGVPATIPSSMTISEETFDSHGVPPAVTEDWGTSEPAAAPVAPESGSPDGDGPAESVKQCDAPGDDAPESSEKTLQSVVEDLVGDIVDGTEHEQRGDDAARSTRRSTDDEGNP